MPVKPTPVEKFLRTLPSTIKIGPYSWKIEVTDQIETSDEEEATGARAWGMTFLNTLVIKLRPDMPSLAFAVGTFLHELYHAALHSFGAKQPRREEDAAEFIELYQTTVFRDNLWLLAWISKGLK